MYSLGWNALQTVNLRSNPRALNKRCGDMKDKSWYKACWYKLYDVEMVAGLGKSLLWLSLLPFPSLLAPPAMTFLCFLLFGSAQVITWLSSCSMWKRLMCDVDGKNIVTFLPSLRLSFVVVIENCSYRVPSNCFIRLLRRFSMSGRWHPDSMLILIGSWLFFCFRWRLH